MPAEPDFERYIAEVEGETKARVDDGEFEHLIYFALQSRAFTADAAIEPALNAREYFTSNSVSEPVIRRFRGFLAALERPSTNERMLYFQKLLPRTGRTVARLTAAYAKAMRFLNAKEILEQNDAYESRGLSSDTSLASSFTVWQALGVLKATEPQLLLQRVLIIGPGSDFAPRTGLDDSAPPRSYQPYAIADALLSHGLAREHRLTIDCADVNDRVLDSVAAGWPRFRREPGTEEFVEYQLGLSGPRNGVRISPLKLNIVTQRETRTKYDLIVATNVLLYLPKPHLALALVNIREMLALGGYCIHNELRPETETYSKGLGFQWLQTRRILVAQGRKAPLYDTFSILRR